MSLTVQELADRFSRLFPGEPPSPAPPPAPAGPAAGGETSTASAVAPTPGLAEIVDFSAKGYHLDVRLQPAQVVAAAQLLDEQGFALDAITGVDWMANDEMEVVYDYFHPEATLRVAARCRVPRGEPKVPTISGVYPGANWHERETHEFFGIHFSGHPNLTPLLLPEDAEYHPLRKDFAA
jgi:NADH-quinone oxidoreductase subunit C